MFSYKIYNPNELAIIPDSHVIPFGHRCSSALVCKYASLRKFSLPFDWTIPTFPGIIQEIIENNFQDFIPDVRNHKEEVLNNNFPNRYGIVLSHFNGDIEEGIHEYNRRIERFNTILNESKKLYFVYINEDYLYDPSYRNDSFNNRIFNEMRELETFLTTKYPTIDYAILYFNFKQHDIPASSNIINIVLHAGEVFDYFYPNYAEQFRNYCGEILTQLFHTKLQLGYSHDIFLG
jgi:hypothetical protein